MEKIANIVALADKYYKASLLIKTSFIRHLPNGKWRVVSRKGKNLGTFDTREEAVKHLQQVEFFKHKKASNNIIDLTNIDSLSYSAVMRELRKECDPEIVKEFLAIYKCCFDSLINYNMDNAPELALISALQLFGQEHPLKIKMEKKATTAPLGEATRVGQYLADIIKFTLNRIPPNKRAKAINTVLLKIYSLNEHELSNKQLPSSSSMGQAITFVKHVLFDQPSNYIREVLNNIVAYLR